MKHIRKHWLFYLLFFIGLFCYMKEYGYAEQYRIPCEMECLFCGEDVFVKMHEARGQKCTPLRLPATEEQKKEYKEQWDFHMFHGKRCYDDAYNRVWWLPEKEWRERGRQAWVAACSMVTASTPQMKVVAVVTSLLCQYGLDCMDEWDYIAEKLHWSEFHFKECEKYAELMRW